MHKPENTPVLRRYSFANNEKVFDPTESAGLGLLNEMSLVETKARLETNERRRAETEANRRKEILMARAEKEADLRERQD